MWTHLRLRFAALFRRTRFEHDLADELAFHVQARADELERRGLSSAAARRRALIEFGNAERIKEEVRDVRVGRWLEVLRQDLHYATRRLISDSLFTTVTLATLALAIAGNTVVFTLVYSVLIRPLPFEESERLVEVHRRVQGAVQQSVTATLFTFVRDASKSFESVAAYDVVASGVNLTGAGVPEHVSGVRATPGLFDVLRVDPRLGRAFAAEDAIVGSEAVILMSEGLWRRRFGADPAIVGSSLRVGGEAHRVVGILPEGISIPHEVDVWTPLRLVPSGEDQANLFQMVARLGEGVSGDQARAELGTVTAAFRTQYPNLLSGDVSLELRDLQVSMTGSVRTPLLFLLAAVGVVLLIACFNIANLTLARESVRQVDTAVCLALGATRGRVMRRVLVETGLLALLGSVLALLVAGTLLPLLIRIAPGDLPLVAAAAVSHRPVVLFTLGLGLVTGITCGVIPAIQTGLGDAKASLVSHSGRVAGSRRAQRFRVGLAVAQVGLALALLQGAGLLTYSYLLLQQVDPGFQPERIVSLQVPLSGSDELTTAGVSTRVDEMVDRLTALPGILGAAAVTNLPTEQGPGLPFDIVGRPDDGGDLSGATQWRMVSPGYFETMEIPLVRGRAFDTRDRSGAPPVIIVNEALALQYFGTTDVLSESLVIGRIMGSEFADPPREIVGVVGNVRELGLMQPPPPQMFVPFAQTPDRYTQFVSQVLPLTWVVQTATAPLGFIESIRSEAMRGAQQIPDVRLLGGVMAAAVARQQFNVLLIGIFSVIALGLCSIGVYSVAAYSMTERRREFGVRAALGATPLGVLWPAMRQTASILIAGQLIGTVVALGMSRLLGSLLFELSSMDPGVLGTAAALLAIVTLTAGALPVKQAVDAQPAETLRED